VVYRFGFSLAWEARCLQGLARGVGGREVGGRYKHPGWQGGGCHNNLERHVYKRAKIRRSTGKFREFESLPNCQ